MNDSPQFRFSAYDQKSSERMLLIAAIGLLSGCEAGKISVDEVQAHLFNPYTIKILRDINAGSQLVELVHKGLFLEDIQSLFGDKKLQDKIVATKEKAIELLSEYEFNPYQENKWVEKDNTVKY